MREMNIFILGTAAGPSIDALGFDRFGIASITKNGTGDYTVTFNAAFGRDDIMGWGSMAGSEGVVTIATINRAFMRVLTFDVAGTPTDRDIFLRILGSEFNYDI